MVHILCFQSQLPYNRILIVTKLLLQLLKSVKNIFQYERKGQCF